MVDEEIVMETIRKMKESGLEDSIIISTLQDIGLNEEQAKNYIARVSAGAVPKKPEPKAVPAEKVPPAPQAGIAPEQAPAEKPQPVPKELTPEEEEVITEAIEEKAAKPTEISPEEKQTIEAIEKIKALPPKPALGPTSTEVPKPLPEAVAEKAAEKVKYHLAEHAEGEEMRHAATQAVLSEQTRRLGEVQESIKRLQKKPPIKMPADMPGQMKALMLELESLKKDFEETKALTAATHALMEKILEVNRKILSRLP